MLLLCALLGLAHSAQVSVEVYDLTNALLASQQVAFDAEAPTLGTAIMHNTKGLGWKYTKISMGTREVPVVTEISGLKAEMPATAWVLTHVEAGGAEHANVAMGDVAVRDGDTLQWRFWSLSELAKSRAAKKLGATPTPTPPAEEEDEGASDAEVLARERLRAEPLSNTGPREVGVVEEEGEKQEQGAGAGQGAEEVGEEEEEEEGDL